MTAELRDQFARASRGEPEAKAFVMAAVDPWLKRLAWRFRPIQEEWEDACQLARLYALEALPEYDPDRGGICNFLQGRLKRRFWDRKDYWQRARRFSKRPVLSLPDVADSRAAPFEEAAITRAMLSAAICRYPPPPRAALALSLMLAGKNLADESRRLGLSRDGLSVCLRYWIKQAKRACATERNPMNPRIYLAGKITKNGWRNRIVSDIDTNERCESRLAGDPWPILPGAVLDLFDYTGPYFTACDHGCAHSKVNEDPCFGDPKHEPYGGLHGLQQEMCQEAARADQVFALCQHAIRMSDIVVAWIAAPELYGTVYELGIAAAQGIPTAIAFCSSADEEKYNPNEYWLAAEGAVWTIHSPTVEEALRALHKALGMRIGTQLLRRFYQRTRTR